MNKIILLLVAALCLSLTMNAQSIVWEKSYGWHDNDVIYNIEPTDAGFIAAGTIDSLGYNWFGLRGRSVLVILNSGGDTMQIIKLEFWGWPCGLKRCFDGDYLVAFGGIDFVTNYTGIRLYKVSEIGEIRWQHDYDNTTNWNGQGHLCVTYDGGALIVGNKPSDPGSGGLTDGYALRVGPNGDEIWRQAVQPNTLSYLRYAEVLNNSSNSFLVSGASGSNLYAAWLDSTGAVYKQHEFWTDPQHTQLLCASVHQTPDSSLIACGSNSSSTNPLWYLGKFTLSGVTVWEEQNGGFCNTPYINTDGYVLTEFSDNNGFHFTKYTPTGYQINPISLGGTFLPKAIKCVAWLDNDSVVFAGSNLVDNIHANQFYFVKMAGVGNGYVSAVPHLLSEEAVRVSLYPNPAQNQTSISYTLPGGTGEAEVTVFEAATGRSIQKYRLDQTTGTLNIDTQGYIPGFYGLRLTASGLASETRKLVILK